MAKVQIKSEKITPFGGIFSIMDQFDALLQDDYQKNVHEGFRTVYNESYQDFRIQIHFCSGQMD